MPRSLLLAAGPLQKLPAMLLNQQSLVVHDDGTQSPLDYDLLVLDGNTLPADLFSARAEAIRSMLKSGRPVLVLGPTPAHKVALAQAGVLAHYLNEGSYAMLISPRLGPNGELGISLSEHTGIRSGGRLSRMNPTWQQDGTILSQEVYEEDAPTTTRELNVMDVRGFHADVCRAVSIGAGKLTATGTDDNHGWGPPDTAHVNLYNVTPLNIYDVVDQSRDGYPGGTVTLQGILVLGVYFDDLTYNTRVQWLVVDHQATVATKMAADSKQDCGWTLGYFNITADPTISSAQMPSSQSSPANVNGETTVTSSATLSIGVSASIAKAGPSGSADLRYTVGSTSSHTITDWAVVQTGADAWLFKQQVPFDGHTAAGDLNLSSIPDFPSISKGALAVETETIWCVNPAVSKQITAKYQYGVQTYFFHKDDKSVSVYRLHQWWWHSYTINLSKAFPT